MSGCWYWLQKRKASGEDMNQHAEHVISRPWPTSASSSNLMGLKVSIMLKPPKVITNYKRAHSAWNPSEKIVLQDRPKKVPNIFLPRIYGYFVHISGKNTKRRRFPLIYELQSGQPCWHIFYGERRSKTNIRFIAS